jgi:hypothetical protein
LRYGTQSAEHGRAARHVRFHLPHIQAVLERDAARIERNAFADERPKLVFVERVFRLVADDNQRWRLIRPLPDAPQRAHSLFPDLLCAQGFRAETELLGHLCGAPGKLTRRQVSARLVRQFARPVDGFGDDRSALDCGSQPVALFRHDDGQLFEPRHRLVLILIKVILIRA